MGVILYLIGYQCNENKGSECIFGRAAYCGPGVLGPCGTVGEFLATARELIPSMVRWY
jgi:hypothetical protein